MTRRRGSVGAAAALFVLALVAPLAGAAGACTGKHTRMNVMTWNLYLGADLTRAIQAPSDEALLEANAEIFRILGETNFAERAKVVAGRIVDDAPTVVSLQEVSLWLTGPIGDPAPATTVAYDFLQILLDELLRQGARYEPVVVQTETDSEAPAGDPYRVDLRMVDRDVLLVQTDIADHATTASGHFSNLLTVRTGSGRELTSTRGWVSADLAVGDRPVRFVNAHLEAFDWQVRLAQARELVAPDGPVGSAPGGVVLLGDLNTGPELPVPENREAFFALTGYGLADTWADLHPGDPGFTAGFSELLDDPPTALEHRVDHVMTFGGPRAQASKIVGIGPDDRTAAGMWASDHVGLVATLRL